MHVINKEKLYSQETAFLMYGAQDEIRTQECQDSIRVEGKYGLELKE